MKNLIPVLLVLIFTLSCHKDGLNKYKISEDLCDAARNSPEYSYVIVLPYDSIVDEFEFPDFISPNGDGYNDVFFIEHSSIINYKINFYNRTYRKIAEFSPYRNNWDGLYGKYTNENPPENGLYHYEIIFKNNVKLSGSFVVVFNKDEYYDMSINDSPCSDSVNVIDFNDPLFQ